MVTHVLGNPQAQMQTAWSFLPSSSEETKLKEKHTSHTEFQ